MSRIGSENHDDIIKWKHLPRYWSFVRGIHRSPVNSPHKRQWRGSLMFPLICAWINGCVNNRDLMRYLARYDVIVMWFEQSVWIQNLGCKRHFLKNFHYFSRTPVHQHIPRSSHDLEIIYECNILETSFPKRAIKTKQATGGFPSQRTDNADFDVFFDVSLNK